MNVPVPTFHTFATQSGRYGYSFTLEHWEVKYVRKETYNTKKEAVEMARNCKIKFTSIADDINKGKASPIHIPSKHESFINKFNNVTKNVGEHAPF